MCCSSGGKARKASVLVTQQSAGPQSPPSAAGKPEAAQLGWEGKDVLPLAKVGSGEPLGLWVRPATYQHAWLTSLAGTGHALL